ncbi:hypothetical protein ACFZAU_32175 [Streptomyces sp. NPDC008238]
MTRPRGHGPGPAAGVGVRVGVPAGPQATNAASFVAALGVYAVTARLGGHRAALCAAGLWAVWPGSGTE